MPRLVAFPASETPALLALRRTLWQLAIVGAAIAATLAWTAPHPGALAQWCALIPLTALAAHYRQALRHRVALRWRVGDSHDVRRRMLRQRPQAHRARGARAVLTSRPAREGRARA